MTKLIHSKFCACYLPSIQMLMLCNCKALLAMVFLLIWEHLVIHRTCDFCGSLQDTEKLCSMSNVYVLPVDVTTVCKSYTWNDRELPTQGGVRPPTKGCVSINTEWSFQRSYQLLVFCHWRCACLLRSDTKIPSLWKTTWKFHIDARLSWLLSWFRRAQSICCINWRADQKF